MDTDSLLDFPFYDAPSDSEAVNALIALYNFNKPYNENRRAWCAKYSSLFEGLQLTTLAAHGYSTDSSYFFKYGEVDVPLIRNTAHGIIDTFVSQIAAMDNPKPTFMTSEGNWKDKRKAEKLRKLVEASYKEKQGRFQNTYKLCEHALKMAAAATGTIAIKVCVYPGENKIVHELHDTLDMFFDYQESSYSEFLTLGTLTWHDPDRVKAMFPGFEEEIEAALKEPPRQMNSASIHGRVRKMVPLYEGWRVTVGDVKGRYVCGLDGGVCLANDEYDYPSPPFAFLSVDPHLWGPFGHSITHHIYESVLRDNMILATIDRSVMRTNKSRTYAVKDNLENPADLERTDDAQVVFVKDMGQVPHDVTAPGFHQSHLMLADRHRADAHDVSGMPEARTGAKADPSITSAIGQRNIAAMVNKRFAGIQTSYIQFTAVDIAALDIRAMREVYYRDGKFTKRWFGKKFFQEIDGEVLDLDEDKYTITGEAVSGLKNTPAARIQQADEFYKAGAISADTYAAATEDYDTPDIIRDENSESEWLEEQMYKWAYADEEEASRPDFYEGPLLWMDLPRALLQTIQGIMQAQIDKLEPERMNFFLMFLSDLDALITQRAEHQRKLQEAATPQAAPPARLNAASPALGIGQEQAVI